MALDIIRKSFCCQLKKLEEIKNAGLVLVINTPSQQSREEICAQILSRYAKVPSRGTPASASIQFGFRDDVAHLYNNVSLQHYEIRTGTFVAGNPGKTVMMDVSTLAVQEQGYETKVDFNSRPMEDAKIVSTIELGAVLLSNVKAFTTGWGEEFLNWK